MMMMCEREKTWYWNRHLMIWEEEEILLLVEWNVWLKKRGWLIGISYGYDVKKWFEFSVCPRNSCFVVVVVVVVCWSLLWAQYFGGSIQTHRWNLNMNVDVSTSIADLIARSLKLSLGRRDHANLLEHADPNVTCKSQKSNEKWCPFSKRYLVMSDILSKIWVSHY